MRKNLNEIIVDKKLDNAQLFVYKFGFCHQMIFSVEFLSARGKYADY
jgi:hypothetical protein